MHARSMLLALAGGALALAPTRAADLPAQLLPIYGGSGGTAFSRSCGADRVLTGLRYRSSFVIDAVGLLCRPIAADGTLGAQTSVGTLAGGGGGTSGTASCPSGQVVIGVKLYYGTYVDGATLFCRTWKPATRSFGTTGNTVGFAITSGRDATELCENATQPVVTIRGRSAMLVDALGFTCNEP
jgi:hypothetical protein